MLKLVYGCLAFSAVALVFLFVSAGDRRNYFHGATKAMNDAIVNPAEILAADKTGAVTQTGNGRIVGYRFNADEPTGEQVWSESFDRFAEGPENPYGAGAIDALAWCAGGCPSAITSVSGRYAAHPSSDDGVVSSLNDLSVKPESLLRVASPREAFVSASSGGGAERLLDLTGRESTTLPVLAPSAIQAAGDRMVVGSAISGTGKLAMLARGPAGWRVAAKSFNEAGLKNVCISSDGKWIGTVSDRVSLLPFSGGVRQAVGPAVSSGTCTVDADGITALYTTSAQPEVLRATRWTPSGKQLWHRDIGAFRPLSQAGSPVLVAFAPDGTLKVIDSLTGKAHPEQKLAHEPYVGADGSVVTTKRNGTPRLLPLGAAGR